MTTTTPPASAAARPTHRPPSALLLVGLSHRSGPLAVLERVAVPEDDRRGLLSELLSSAAVTEALLVSTCNRVEVYVVAQDVREAEAQVLNGSGDRLSWTSPGSPVRCRRRA